MSHAEWNGPEGVPYPGAGAVPADAPDSLALGVGAIGEHVFVSSDVNVIPWREGKHIDSPPWFFPNGIDSVNNPRPLRIQDADCGVELR